MYYISKTVSVPFDRAIERLIEALAEHGFGILSDIDVTAKMKEKLNIDFHNYRILGACNPKLAYSALQQEDKIGVMLPCNVIVQELGPNDTEIAAVDPIASMSSVKNPKLLDIAKTVKKLLEETVISM
ncbi:DUF302 domain-containing protein [bacterium]|nr:DUF302 domain-containing protein [candidate division CSSED10-310 bacterium]